MATLLTSNNLANCYYLGTGEVLSAISKKLNIEFEIADLVGSDRNYSAIKEEKKKKKLPTSRRQTAFLFVIFFPAHN